MEGFGDVTAYHTTSNLTAHGALDGQRFFGRELYLETRREARLGSLLPHTSQALPRSIELFTACEVGHED